MLFYDSNTTVSSVLTNTFFLRKRNNVFTGDINRQTNTKKSLCTPLNATAYTYTPLSPFTQPTRPRYRSGQSFYIHELGYGQRTWPTGPAQPAVGQSGNISRPTATRQAWLCRPGQDTLPDPQTSGVPVLHSNPTTN